MSSHPSQTEIQTAPIQSPANEIAAVPKFYRAEDGSLQPIPPGLMEARAATIEAHRKLKEAGEGVGTIFPDPETAEEFNAFPINPKYVLAHDGWTKDRMTVEYAVKREIREKLGLPEEWEPDERKIRWHKEQLARLEKADAAPRCGHIYADGTRCRGPRLKNGHECYAHTRMKRTATRSLALMPVEDANSVVINIMEIHRAMCDDEITERRAGLLLYGHQLALTALHQVSFKETDPREMVTEESGDRIIGRSGDREIGETDELEIEAEGDLVEVDLEDDLRTVVERDVRTRNEDEEAPEKCESPELGFREAAAEQVPPPVHLASSAPRAFGMGPSEGNLEPTAGDAGGGMECAKSNKFGDEGDGTGGGGGSRSGDLAIW